MRGAESYRNVRLITPEDPAYFAFMRRMAEARPSRGGPRAAGELLGGLVEQCVRHWLSHFVPLQEERILEWEQRLRNNRHGVLYREIDAVWKIDPESFCLYEMKLTYAENMMLGYGIKQLDASTEILLANRSVRYVLRRLVYVGAEPLPVLDGEIAAVLPDDEFSDEGVIWVPPNEVEEAAVELEIELPENWLEPEAREGFVEDPERDEWRQFAEKGEETTEAEPEIDNPLARALREAMKRGNDR